VAETEASFTSLPDPVSCSTGERIFSNIVLAASGHSIPSGQRKDYTPDLPCKAVPPTRHCDNFHCMDPQNPEIDNLNMEILSIICESSKKVWREKVESCGPKTNRSHFWSLIGKLSRKRLSQPPNQPITFGAKVCTKPQAIAKKFNTQFTSVSTHKQNPKSRRVMQNLKIKHNLDPDFNPFTEAATIDAIRIAKNLIATGPDGLTTLHMKQLGPRGISYLTKLFNLSLNHANLPSVWKIAHIIPIPKPGKPLNLSSSYCPISLLSPTVKILEHLLLPFINLSLPLSSSQHGFRPFCSTSTCLLSFITQVANGFNQN
jgi:hypothetical protein